MCSGFARTHLLLTNGDTSIIMIIVDISNSEQQKSGSVHPTHSGFLWSDDTNALNKSRFFWLTPAIRCRSLVSIAFLSTLLDDTNSEFGNQISMSLSLLSIR